MGAVYLSNSTTSSTRLRAESPREGLEIRNKYRRARDIRFRFFIETAINGVVRTLEQLRFAIGDQLHAFRVILRIEMRKTLARQHNRRGDIVLELNFIRRAEVGSQFEDAPGSIRRIVSHAQIVSEQLLILELELVTRQAIDTVDAETFAPVVAPFRLIVTLHRDQKLTHRLRYRREPFVVFVRVLRRRSHELDHRAKGAFGAQNGALRASTGLRFAIDGRKILRDNLLDLLHLALKIGDNNRRL